MSMGEMWGSLGSAMAGMMFIWAMYQNYFPYELRRPMKKYSQKLKRFIYPYIEITIPEYEGNGFERSKAYLAIERYLNKISSEQARRLKANIIHDCQSIVLSMEDHEEVTDEFQGIKLWWACIKHVSSKQSISFYPREDEKKHFTLTFHQRHRELITNKYLKHVLDEGKAITVRERQRKLYTNNKSENSYGGRRSMWSHVLFKHPSKFDTLAMDPKRKQEILDDLITFSKAKDYYAKIGKAWKRGYLLHGPPGTGKSSMIAAIANFLNYDVYDLELTSVKDNTELRKLLINTSSKSIIVIEDIDCSLDLAGKREKNKKKSEDEEKEKDVSKEMKKKMEEESSNKDSKVTLSGLLNFIDGLWSACGEERLIIFTTNYIEKLDPALIRKGRMDKHIEMSFCDFEAFKILAKNYLNIIESHHLFPTVLLLLEDAKITPADIADNLMPKSSNDDADICLERVINGIQVAKEEAARILLKAEEEQRLRAHDEANGSEASPKEVKENGDIIKTKSTKELIKENNGETKEE